MMKFTITLTVLFTLKWTFYANGQHHSFCTSPFCCADPNLFIRNMMNSNKDANHVEISELAYKTSLQNLPATFSEVKITSKCSQSFLQVLEDLIIGKIYILKGNLYLSIHLRGGGKANFIFSHL